MATTKKPRYRRIMLKFSGEALLGKGGQGIDPAVIEYIAEEIKPLIASRVQVGIIIGGGNFFRGAKLNHNLISRVTADHLGMIATMLNALAMRDVFEHAKISTKIMSALPIDSIIERYDYNKASDYLDKNFLMIFAGGTGNPFVTTDTALGLRGIELNADLLLKATNVDGVYSADPQRNPSAKFYSHLTYQEALAKELAVMDLAAFCLCRDHKMKLRVFSMHKKGALLRIIQGANEGTLVE
ncbi:MAG: uridylate kinase [uncultured bacterium]|nr:MAG: uridylate kinase [uncultured bacterium]